MKFKAFFSKAFGEEVVEPLPYQEALALGEWPDILNIPTGLGKTAAVTLAWLYKQQVQQDSNTPKRLIWCLPMRVLVEQTESNIRGWLQSLALEHRVGVQVLMGGSQDLKDQSWAESPEKPTILIGTQDMLLSRALMRGYGMSRYLWPIHYALLHNDAYWVFDEVQLMGPALRTAAQLEAFRRDLPLAKSSRSLWVSATLNADWLATVDFKGHINGLTTHSLSEADRAHPVSAKRVGASKTLSFTQTRLDKESAKQQAKSYLASLCDEVIQHHQPDSQTLVILNRVDRAQGLYEALKERHPSTELLLLHARFRAADRQRIEVKLKAKDAGRNRIIIATQAIEAGVDISSATLFTELAPWSSLVQRLGRCNRYGEHSSARVFCIDIDESLEAAPYTSSALSQARAQLEAVLAQGGDAAPGRLPAVADVHEQGLVLRRRDFMELFNTDPDLSGLDVDVSPYIRDSGLPQCQVFWRDFEESPQEQPAVASHEICQVGIAQLRDHLKKASAWVFDHLEGRWQALKADRLKPGMIVMCRASEGGYRPEIGFKAASKGKVDDLQEPAKDVLEAYSSDRRSQTGRFVPLAEHLEDARQSAARLCDQLRVEDDHAEAIITAAHHHDWGKAHEAFQFMLTRTGDAPATGAPWAKSARGGGPADYRMNPTDGQEQGVPRPCFRHELASALAWLDTHKDHPQRDLVAYLIAAHHGKVRMGLRALPTENQPKDSRLYARGVWAGDELPALKLGDTDELPKVPLRLDLMRLGEGDMGQSWVARTQEVLEQLGPFQLAWLEALVRIADWRASKEVQSQDDKEAPQS
ncbi:CRISPR-associated helicase Cas3' [Motiliproteus sp. SC1-56]|uniref:type I-G CRISPR-associated helicase/endonuclease Cas3g n=1 Tax=Motiliproteus sp. SC1-56 TaxID=2799565 RepID=UPI001A90036C|nr:CRISPR-associated helicase Cas3' [Motiliproteus sp. SC1-56]